MQRKAQTDTRFTGRADDDHLLSAIPVIILHTVPETKRGDVKREEKRARLVKGSVIARLCIHPAIDIIALRKCRAMLCTIDELPGTYTDR